MNTHTPYPGLSYNALLRNTAANEGEAVAPDSHRIGLCFFLRGGLAIDVKLFFHTADDTAIGEGGREEGGTEGGWEGGRGREGVLGIKRCSFFTNILSHTCT